MLILFFSYDLIDAAKNANRSVYELLQLQKDFIAKFYYAKHIILDCIYGKIMFLSNCSIWLISPIVFDKIAYINKSFVQISCN